MSGFGILSFTINYHPQGIEPDPNLIIFKCRFIAIDFGETNWYYGNSYMGLGSLSIVVDELLDINGDVIGYPAGVGYGSLAFYSGDFDPKIYSFPR